MNEFFPKTNEAIIKVVRKFKRNEVDYDDILDAIAGAVVLKYSKKLNTLPANPEIDSKGLRMEIVYPEIK